MSEEKNLMNEQDLEKVSGGSYMNCDARRVDQANCLGCGCCADACPMGCISMDDGVAYIGSDCIGCGVCEGQCPADAISAM